MVALDEAILGVRLGVRTGDEMQLIGGASWGEVNVLVSNRAKKLLAVRQPRLPSPRTSFFLTSVKMGSSAHEIEFLCWVVP